MTPLLFFSVVITILLSANLSLTSSHFSFIVDNVKSYSMMYAKTYHEKYAAPLVCRLKDVIRSILLQFIEKTQELRTMLDRANNQIRDLTGRVNRLEAENERLRGVERDYARIRLHFGGERVDEMINEVKAHEIDERQVHQQRVIKRSRDYVR